MAERILSIFVDESGSMYVPDRESRFYIVGMVFHDQSVDISREVEKLEQSDAEVGLVGHCFHAGPLIRHEKHYSMLSRQLRGRIFSRMMTFARRVDFKYHCLGVDKRFIDSADQIFCRLKTELVAFIAANNALFSSLERVKIYYDCGQAHITRLLHQVFESEISCNVSFAEKVRPSRYRLFQLADLICTLHLIELKLSTGLGLSQSEHQFFGGQRMFRHNILRYIKAKEI